MENCFETLVGITNTGGCDCDQDRPDGKDTVQRWYYEVFHSDADPDDTLVFTAQYKLPAGEALVELYENGERVDDSRISRSGKILTITDPLPGAYYQLWYYAYVSAAAIIPAYDTSTSGLYLSDILPIEEVAGLATCDADVWEMVMQKRTYVIKEVIASMNTAVKKTSLERYPKFSGYVGTEQSTAYLDTTYGYAGIRIRTNPIKSGYLRIRRIASYFEKTGVISAWLLDKNGTVVTPELKIRTIGGGRKCVNDIGITLPMLDDFNTCQDYFLMFRYDVSNRPRLNKTYCAPCNKSGITPITFVNRYGTLNPWPDDYRGPLSWNNYIITGGYVTDTLEDFADAPDTVSEYMNGLAMEIEVGCDLTKGYCKMLEGQGPEIMAVATAIQRRWAAELVGAKNRSSAPSRSNIAKGQQQASDAAVWEAEYAEVMTYLVSTINEDSNDCVMCKPKIQMSGLRT